MPYAMAVTGPINLEGAEEIRRKCGRAFLSWKRENLTKSPNHLRINPHQKFARYDFQNTYGETSIEAMIEAEELDPKPTPAITDAITSKVL
jgi:hypothetical protein